MQAVTPQLSLGTQCQSESVPVSEPTWLMGRYYAMHYAIYHIDIEGALSNQLHTD